MILNKNYIGCFVPNYKGHLLGGVITFGLINLSPATRGAFVYSGIIAKTFELFFCLAGALAPDIDIRSKGRNILDKVLLFCVFVSCALKMSWGVVFVACIFVFTRMVGHRKITHNPIFLAVVPYCLFVVLADHFPLLPILGQKSFYLAFLAGAYSHLILDFWPKKYLPAIFFSIDNVNFNKYTISLGSTGSRKN